MMIVHTHVMAEKRNPLGPTGETVRANIERLRTKQNLGYADLSRRLEEVGRPIPDLGLRRIESGDRRVDADDLVALAVALDVSPVTLLMPAGVDMADAVQVTGLGEPAAAIGVWEWLRGRFARPGLPADSRGFQQISVDTWPLWEQEQVLGQFAGRADGDD